MHYSINLFCLLIFVVIVESIPNYYEILKVSKDASTREIKTAYKRLMLRYHPDKNKDNPVALEYSKEINEAYRILCDEKNRMEYDKELNKSSGSFSTSGESSTSSVGESTTSGESSPSSDGSPTTSGESSPSSVGASTTSGESSPSSDGSYPKFAGTSSKRKKAHTDFGISYYYTF
uniref:DnaJ homolog subfamily B member 9 n=1 Tax=Meloidogyne incognita TaxID=6306 RepID=A0A914LR95_MELIC